MGLDKNGFKRERYSEIEERTMNRARELFGDDINLGNRSPLGLFLRIVAWFQSQLWELAEKVYYSAFKNTAEGISLDNVGQYIGIKRKAALRASGEILVNGVDGTFIPIGFKVSSGEKVFETTTEGVIQGGSIVLRATAINPGPDGNVPAGTINEIDNPIVGVDDVTNPEAFTGGRDAERDEMFRERYDRVISLGGASTISSIESSLLNEDDIIYAQVEENDSMSTIDGIPPKSIAPFVYGGEEQRIAEIIFNTKAGGIRSFGDIEKTVLDSRGNGHTIGFSRPDEVEIFINANLTTNVDFPADGHEQIRTAILKYIGGVDEDTTEYTGLGLGQDVIYTQLIGLCHTVGGVIDVDLEISTNGSEYIKSNIAIATREVSITRYDQVMIS